MRALALVLAAGCVLGPAVTTADELATTLEPYVGEVLDLVELGTGKQFVRPRLEKIVEKDDVTQSLRLVEEGKKAAVTTRVATITKIVAGRETVYENESAATGAAAKRATKAREQEARDAASLERMKANKVNPWPARSTEDHEAKIKELKAHVEEVRELFPGLAVMETHEFIVATDFPPAVIKPYVANLDAMHDFLCNLYGIPRGQPVWFGKCLVFAFQKEADFEAYEARFQKATVKTRQAGVCHKSHDGGVVMACRMTTDPADFGHLLVHETSHGFNFRWVSPVQIPSWLNEGIAEWVGAQVVPQCTVVPVSEAKARAMMQRTGTLGRDFWTRYPIEFDQYGVASQLVRFLIATDSEKFCEFVRGIKEGMKPEESLKAAFKGSTEDLVAAFGKSVGVPQLKP